MPEKRPRNYFGGEKTNPHGRTVLMRGKERVQKLLGEGGRPVEPSQDAQDGQQSAPAAPAGSRSPIDPRTFDAHVHCSTPMERLTIGNCAGRRCTVCGRVFQLVRSQWFDVT